MSGLYCCFGLLLSYCWLAREGTRTLRPGGQILLEPNTAAAIEQRGEQARSWYTSASGLFSDRPHLVLQEHSWDPDVRAATTRYFVVDAESYTVVRHASSYQAWRDHELRDLLTRTGFEEIERYDGLSGEAEPAAACAVLNAWVARKA